MRLAMENIKHKNRKIEKVRIFHRIDILPRPKFA